MNITDIYKDYSVSKISVPSYRLGQCICNSMFLRDTCIDGDDLFIEKCDYKSIAIFLKMCETYDWDLEDLPIFGGDYEKV